MRRRNGRRPLRALVLALLLIASGAPVAAQSGAAASDDYAARFDRAWRLVDERYWGLESRDIDWDSIGAEYRPQALGAENENDFYRVLERMYEELDDDHSIFVPPSKVAEIRESYGSLPCVAIFAELPGGSLIERASAPLHLPLQLGQAQLPDLRDRQRLANVTYGLTSEGVGYVRLPDLASDGVAGAVRSAVQELEGAGAWAFVLDLRGNPGGRLVTMMEVAGVFTRGFLWRTITSWTFPLPYPAIGLVATELPLAVLIDGGVNSAAEGLAGALQANGRAVVVGERSAGNVEALLPFCLRDGSQAWIASGVLAPLFGPTWEGRGVVPDVESPTEEAPERAVELLEARR